MRSARRKTIGIGAGVSWRGDTLALRHRIARPQAAAGVRPLRWHDLRHTYGSVLAARDVDLMTIQAVMGHSALATTGRYLHARSASEQAARFPQSYSGASCRRRPIAYCGACCMRRGCAPRRPWRCGGRTCTS